MSARERVAEFVRQARRLRDADHKRIYIVYTDPEAEEAVLSLDDLDELLKDSPAEALREAAFDLPAGLSRKGFYKWLRARAAKREGGSDGQDSEAR